MNLRKYKFSVNETENKEAEKIITKISELVNKYNYERFFSNAPHFNGADMRKLNNLIKQYEELYYSTKRHHHNVHLYCLVKVANNEFEIQTYDKNYGDEITSEFVLHKGTSAKEVLKTFWEKDKIPPCVVLNAKYYCGDIRIKDLIDE